MNKYQLIDLDQGVTAALNFFIKNKVANLNLKKFNFPLVIGSGNAFHTGQIIFSKQLALLANESNLKEMIKAATPLIKRKIIVDAVIISASGEKDASWEIDLAQKHGLKTTLLTCSPNSSGAQIAHRIIAYRKIPEPYTYNISTYLGMILSATGENPKTIKTFLQKIKLIKNFSKYTAYSFVLPDKFVNIVPMLYVKRDELFGPRLNLRAFTYSEARHSKFVVPSDKELVISFEKNKYFGKKENRWEIKLPKNNNQALMMSVVYFLIGKIQKSKPPYFKKNIANYCQAGPLAYGHKKPFDVIVK